VTLQAGGDSVTPEPPARPTFEVTAEREGPTSGPGELRIEFELEWPEDADVRAVTAGWLSSRWFQVRMAVHRPE